ncbi:SIR2 family protein [Bacillus safensis]|uniref:SIR2 family protein n=1 Tax=Bacillus safensis TaxID=561879 RepID=UPI001CD010ED|nr:SIR2 family protein [Bacillus safensis]MBZ9521898.1 SIR2 family protein [Bacillus safensis]
MSSTNLTNIVITKLKEHKIEEEGALKILIKFIQDFYSKKDFQFKNDYNFLKELIDIFKEENLIDIKLHYSCNDIPVNTTTHFQDKCMNCGNSINVSTNVYKHEVTSLYSLKKKKCHKLFDEAIKIEQELSLDFYLEKPFYKKHFNELLARKDYLIPFIGAGLSIPFNLPSWPEMLKTFSEELEGSAKPYYLDLIKEGNYMQALTLLSERSLLSDSDIQLEIQKLFDERLDITINEEDHNYKDLINLESSFYLTTNYDNIFTSLKAKNQFIPPLRWNEIDNIQTFLTDKKGSMIHLHGVVHVPQTMIVTQYNYEKLYNDEKFESLLSSFMSNQTFLFLGFSFSDKFFVDLYDKIRSKIKGTHFIILPNVSFEKAKEFSEKGLKTIGIKVSKDDAGNLDSKDLIKGIKCILNKLQK